MPPHSPNKSVVLTSHCWRERGWSWAKRQCCACKSWSSDPDFSKPLFTHSTISTQIRHIWCASELRICVSGPFEQFTPPARSLEPPPPDLRLQLHLNTQQQSPAKRAGQSEQVWFHAILLPVCTKTRENGPFHTTQWLPLPSFFTESVLGTSQSAWHAQGRQREAFGA